MEKLHHVAKYFSSGIENRNKHDSALKNHRHLPTNKLDQDHNGTRIVAAFKLLKSALRIKTGTFFIAISLGCHTFLQKGNGRMWLN